MANDEDYERVLLKAELAGASKLNQPEMEMLKKMYSQAGARGNRARRIVDGR